jgi:hypothetical protein
MENTPFGKFSTGLHHPNQLAASGRILVFGRLAAIFAELKFAGLLNLQRFAAKKLGYMLIWQTSVHPLLWNRTS